MPTLLPPILSTPRLILRPWTVEDVDAAFAIYSQPEVGRYFGTDGHVMTDRAEAVAMVERRMAIQHPIHAIWAIELRENSQVVGNASLLEIEGSGSEPLQPTGEIEVGWALHPDHWGRGYATESAAACLRHAARHGVARVLAVTESDNTRSQAVCQRLGMTHRGISDAYYNRSYELFDITLPDLAGT